MAPQMIRADGVDWPIDSFIDNYRMLRTDGHSLDFYGRDPLCDVLTSDGEYRTRQRASQINWGGVNAFSSQELPFGKFCQSCATEPDIDELTLNQGYCARCADVDEYGEWCY